MEIVRAAEGWAQARLFAWLDSFPFEGQDAHASKSSRQLDTASAVKDPEKELARVCILAAIRARGKCLRFGGKVHGAVLTCIVIPRYGMQEGGRIHRGLKRSEVEATGAPNGGAEKGTTSYRNKRDPALAGELSKASASADHESRAGCADGNRVGRKSLDRMQGPMKWRSEPTGARPWKQIQWTRSSNLPSDREEWGKYPLRGQPRWWRPVDKRVQDEEIASGQGKEVSCMNKARKCLA